MIIRSKAPLRISFGGGGTDVPPYPEERGGAVLSVTINKYAYGTLIPTGEKGVSVESLDYDMIANYNTPEDMMYNGELDLVKAALRHQGINDGVKLFLHSDAPPGSGLGSSSTMCVALVGLLNEWKKIPMTDYEVAKTAYLIERKELGIPGGMQDQYAATFGGFNFIEFEKDRVIVNPLRIKRDILNELEYNLLLCFTGTTRGSANIIDEQVDGFIKKKGNVADSLDETKRIAFEMKKALLTADLRSFGDLLHTAWELKKNFSSKITSPYINAMYETGRKHGALGGKILGAGGGGYLLLYCPFEKKHIIAKELEKVGGQLVGFGFENKGLQIWEGK